MKTDQNLMTAFTGESQANRKYLAFADKARKDGFEKVARLFEVVAEAETIHAVKQYQLSGNVKTTLENLHAAAEGENYEHSSMYPPFIKEAEEENAKAARAIFHLANEAEKVHEKLFLKAAEAVEKSSDIAAESFHLCPVCGYVSENEAPEKCPICGAPSSSFKKY
ncbi:MAG: rubrerythrin family protein [Syntrophomonadaceae bacterium]|jgi:rubrerythrin|nr:rubrerythrin family protein [Bacillota bacterium]NLM89492.1 rubrerythrin family protein [Syntrophomonadaceae bacterium]HQD90887.1 rubrerythrin family protein [Syntrophomonadaceae bacterium]